ncbi:allophanate hydrolase [Alicyclobacillus vulcanalis]|uniref:Allophanate hydrolase n=1 Tax=Alicyclobacillus vulcanalis TaxID=252246 RepID=A0A1N7N4N1_9BACL|nr:allophanate hydrolase [Alicyclobacillus vulcanalis]SIS93322.1 allophanate hydrolase [Alicyclobacillus vulcanalis]
MNATTVAALRRAYRSGRVTPFDVIEEVVRKAESGAAWNVWITPPSQERLEPYLKELRREDMDRKPLWGIPFAVKDNIDVAGMPTTAACPAYAYEPKAHASVVARLVQAGAIPVGKTNLDQFATGLVGTRSPYGEVANAHRPAWVSGGSSSGSAVAVALGQVPFALGTDTAGSGRVPAALNGVVGYKPRPGGWPNEGVVPACKSLDCVSVFTRSIADAAWIQAVMARIGAAAESPNRFVVPSRVDTWFGSHAAAFQRAWERALSAVSSAGVAVEEVPLPELDEASAMLYEGPWIAERWASLGAFVEGHRDEVLPVTRAILESGRDRLASDLFRAQHRLLELRAAVANKLEGAVLLMPTVGGTWTRDEVRQDPLGTNRALGAYTHHANLLQLASLSLPCGAVDEAMPFGLSLYVPGHREAELFVAARWFADLDEDLAGSGPWEDEADLVAVCGLHMRGMPLNPELVALGAEFVEIAKTAPAYRLFLLDTEPEKPGLVRDEQGGEVELELWRLPKRAWAAFVAKVRAPLALGNIRLADGREVIGFVCEAGAPRREDITAFGGYRAWRERN